MRQGRVQPVLAQDLLRDREIRIGKRRIAEIGLQRLDPAVHHQGGNPHEGVQHGIVKKPVLPTKSAVVFWMT